MKCFYEQNHVGVNDISYDFLNGWLVWGGETKCVIVRPTKIVFKMCDGKIKDTEWVNVSGMRRYCFRYIGQIK